MTVRPKLGLSNTQKEVYVHPRKLPMVNLIQR